MDVGQLFLGCVADNYLRYFKSLTNLFAIPQYIELGGRTYMLGRKLGEGGAADVFLATQAPTSTAEVPQQYALKKVRSSIVRQQQCTRT